MKNIVSEKSKIRYLNVFVYLLLFYLIPSKGMQSNVFKTADKDKIQKFEADNKLYYKNYNLLNIISPVKYIENLERFLTIAEREKTVEIEKEKMDNLKKKRKEDAEEIFKKKIVNLVYRYYENPDNFEIKKEILSFPIKKEDYPGGIHLDFIMLIKNERTFFEALIGKSDSLLISFFNNKTLSYTHMQNEKESNNLTVMQAYRILFHLRVTVIKRQYLCGRNIKKFSIYSFPLYELIKKTDKNKWTLAKKKSLTIEKEINKKKIFFSIHYPKEFSLYEPSLPNLFQGASDEVYNLSDPLNRYGIQELIIVRFGNRPSVNVSLRLYLPTFKNVDIIFYREIGYNIKYIVSEEDKDAPIILYDSNEEDNQSLEKKAFNDKLLEEIQEVLFPIKLTFEKGNLYDLFYFFGHIKNNIYRLLTAKEINTNKTKRREDMFDEVISLCYGKVTPQLEKLFKDEKLI